MNAFYQAAWWVASISALSFVVTNTIRTVRKDHESSR
jgi:hypothetical protein